MADLRGKTLDQTREDQLTKGTGGVIEDGHGVEYFNPDDKVPLSYFDNIELDMSTDDNFSAGTLVLKRQGDTVTLTASVNPGHSSNDDISTSEGFIPAEWRPTGLEVGNVYSISIVTGLMQIRITTGGAVRFVYRNFDGTAADRTNAGSLISVSYNSVQS